MQGPAGFIIDCNCCPWTMGKEICFLPYAERNADGFAQARSLNLTGPDEALKMTGKLYVSTNAAEDSRGFWKNTELTEIMY